MRTRMIVLSLDDICRLFQDYCALTGFPDDARAEKLLYNQQQKKLGLVVESNEWTQGQLAEEVRFELKRFYGVGGQA